VLRRSKTRSLKRKCSLKIKQFRGFTSSEFTNIYCTEQQVEKIIADPRVRAVKFTGSTRGGTHIAKLCGRYLKKGTFELTGNDPFLVLEEANIQKAAQTAYKSRMTCNAQTGFSAKRIIVEDVVYEAFRDTLLDLINRRTRIGDPLDEYFNLGPMAVPAGLDLLKHQLKKAQGDGGQIIYGDPDFKMTDPGLQKGNWFAPVVIEGVDTHSESFQEEFFGPVFNLYKAPSSKECLDLANKSDYGLGGTIFTEDLDLAEQYATTMRCGSVAVNDRMMSYSDLPSGGIKQSGFGRECYKDGLLEIMYRKSVIGKNW
jgi:succinate-semialdehyde dehydrogenase / glutarate-semialdehyde dehydrogenase